jgi:peptidyl-prolyl cis-trans isomerase SurA
MPVLIHLRGFASTLALAFGFGALLAASLTGAKAQTGQDDTLKIAAVVDDRIISEYDVIQRLRLIIATTGLRVTPETLPQIRPQVINQLVDEKLEVAEANKQNVNVADGEVEERIDQIAKATNRAKQEVLSVLTANNIDTSTLIQQIQAQIMWEKLVVRRFFAQSSVSEEDVTAQMAQLKESAGKPELQIAEIFLSVDNPSQIDDVRNRALRLVDELRKGAPFDAVASQFSQSPSAASGGDLGWVKAGSLNPDIESALGQMEIGGISEPIQVPAGFYIMGLRNKRVVLGSDPNETRLEMRHVVFGAAKTAALAVISTARLHAEKFSSEVTGCDGIAPIAVANGGQVVGDAIRMRAGDMPPAVRAVVLAAEEGKASKPVQLDNGFHVFAICRKVAQAEGGLPSREDVELRLRDAQLQLKARRYLRDLRRDATIEIK